MQRSTDASLLESTALRQRLGMRRILMLVLGVAAVASAVAHTPASLVAAALLPSLRTSWEANSSSAPLAKAMLPSTLEKSAPANSLACAPAFW